MLSQHIRLMMRTIPYQFGPRGPAGGGGARGGPRVSLTRVRFPTLFSLTFF